MVVTGVGAVVSASAEITVTETAAIQQMLTLCIWRIHNTTLIKVPVMTMFQ